MPEIDKNMTTQQFAEQAGISISILSKWLRSGKIKGYKKGGKWMIPADQLAMVSPQIPTAPSAAVDKKSPSATAEETKANTECYSLEEFSAMTYLTSFGVERYIREGRLSGTKDVSGKWRIGALNLEKNDIKRLLRK